MFSDLLFSFLLAFFLFLSLLLLFFVSFSSSSSPPPSLWLLIFPAIIEILITTKKKRKQVEHEEWFLTRRSSSYFFQCFKQWMDGSESTWFYWKYDWIIEIIFGAGFWSDVIFDTYIQVWFSSCMEMWMTGRWCFPWILQWKVSHMESKAE